MGENPKVSGVYASTEQKGLKYHKIHKDWLDSVDATITEYREKKYSGLMDNSFLEYYNGQLVDIDKEADIYVIENARAIYALPELQKQNPEAEKIYLATSWNLFGLQPYNLHKQEVHNSLRAINELLDTYLLRRTVRRYSDRIITVSPLYREKLTELFPEKKIDVVKPVSKNQIKQSPSLETNNAIFVGANRDHKGVDLLVEAWPQVRQEIKDAELTIVGKDHKNYEQEGVETLGFVEDLEDAYENKSLYIHPARIDAFSVSTLEAMKAGFPTVVTDQTGAKSQVKKVSKRLITKPDSKKLAESVIEYFNKKTDSKKEISQEFIEITQHFRYDNSEKQFQEAIIK